MHLVGQFHQHTVRRQYTKAHLMRKTPSDVPTRVKAAVETRLAAFGSHRDYHSAERRYRVHGTDGRIDCTYPLYSTIAV